MEEKAAVRVVALQTAAVDALYALELQHLLVGRSHDCTNPPQIQSLPCVSSIYPGDQSPLDLGFKEQGFIRKALAPFEINLKLLRELRPDVIITEDRCEACGGRLDELQKACGSFIFGDDKRCVVLSLKPSVIEEVFEGIQSIANVCKFGKKGRELVSNLMSRWKHARERTPQWADGVPSINVACLQWLEPLIGAGHWIPDIVECAGGFNMFGDAGHHSPLISWPEFMHMDPDVIVIICIGLDIERASCRLAAVQDSRDWRQLRAAIAKRVYVVDGEKYFNIPGPAVVDTAELMVEILHGEDNTSAHVFQGTGYVRWEVKDSNEDVTHLQELDSLRRLDQGVGTSEVLKDRCIGTQRISEDHLLEQAAHSGQVEFCSPLPSDSDSTVSSDYRGRFMGHLKRNSECLNAKGGNVQSMSKRFIEKSRTPMNYESKIVGDDSSRQDIQATDPSALRVGGNLGPPFSRHSKHGSLSDQIDISPLDKRMPVYFDDQFAIQSHESTPIKGSSFAVKPSNARNSCESISTSTSSRKPSVTDSEKDVLSRMWASTEAAAKCQSPKAANSPVKHKSQLHKKSKDLENVSNMIMGSPVSKLVLETDLHADKMVQWVGNKSSFACLNRKTYNPRVGLLSRGNSMGGPCDVANDALINSDLSMPNPKTYFIQKALSLKKLVIEAVKELPSTDCLLLSGGVGSTILAEAAKLAFLESFKTGVTVLISPEAKDKHFSQLVSKEYCMKHVIVGGGDKGDPMDLLEKQLDFVVETLGTFNPSEVQRSIALATALREVKRLGLSSIVTGDGADELFSGHHYMHSMGEDEFHQHRHQVLSSISHSSVLLGTALGIKVMQPYLNPKVVKFAVELSKDDLVGPKDGKVHDKLLLRHAFSEVITVWRSKDPIEVGSGTFVLSQSFARQVSWAQFKSETARIFREDRVQIKDPEQLAYYLAFQRIFRKHSPPGMIRWGLDPCVKCGYNLDLAQQGTYCLTCGHHFDRTRTFGTFSDDSQPHKESGNAPKESHASEAHHLLRPIYRLEHLPKNFHESPANKYCDTTYSNLKFKGTPLEKFAAVQTDHGTLNDAAANDDTDAGGNLAACKVPVAELQQAHTFELPNEDLEVRNPRRWFWEVVGGIIGLVIVLRLRVKRAGS